MTEEKCLHDELVYELEELSIDPELDMDIPHCKEVLVESAKVIKELTDACENINKIKNLLQDTSLSDGDCCVAIAKLVGLSLE